MQNGFSKMRENGVKDINGRRVSVCGFEKIDSGFAYGLFRFFLIVMGYDFKKLSYKVLQ